MHKERLFSFVRKAAIVALLVSAALLLLQTDYFTTLSGRGSRGAERSGGATAGSAASVSAEAAAALLPRAVLVRFSDGSAQGSAFDGETTEQTFRRFAAVLGEALGSAGAPEAIPEGVFRGGMDAGCVFVDFGMAFPLGLLSDWLGSGGGGAEDRSADLLYLGLDGEEVRFFFREGKEYYRCPTATQAETLTARMEDFQAAEAYFAFESERLAGTEPYTVVLKTMPELYAVNAGSAGSEATPQRLMDAMGMNSYITSSYSDADGTLVLMEGGRTLRLNPDGTLYYRDTDGARELAAGDSVAAVNYACRLAQQSLGAFCGDARVVFTGMETVGSVYTIHFDYAVSGIPVRLTGRHAATVTIDGGALRWASMELRNYTHSTETETVLPMIQAAAIASAQGGGTLALVYVDGGERTHCVWVND